MKLHYECEICGFVYPLEWQARYCESQVPAEPKYAVGDKVQFPTRYDGMESDVITEVKIICGPLCSPMSGWEDEVGFRERIGDNPQIRRFHQYGYVVSKLHQMGKDSYTQTIAEDAIKRRLRSASKKAA